MENRGWGKEKDGTVPGAYSARQGHLAHNFLCTASEGAKAAPRPRARVRGGSDGGGGQSTNGCVGGRGKVAGTRTWRLAAVRHPYWQLLLLKMPVRRWR
jgi:hypothetical protein